MEQTGRGEKGESTAPGRLEEGLPVPWWATKADGQTAELQAASKPTESYRPGSDVTGVRLDLRGN